MAGCGSLTRGWIVDSGIALSESDAAFYEMPFGYVTQWVKPERIAKADPALRDLWWRFGRRRVEMRLAMKTLPRFIATGAHSKHRFFVWLPITTSPDQALITMARADETTLGLLHSRFHELWSLRMGSSIGVGNDPRYTSTSCFETFPFPTGLTPADTAHQRTEALPDAALIHQALQRAPRLARASPRSARRHCRRRLRLGRLHAADARRRNPAPPAGVESGAGGALTCISALQSRVCIVCMDGRIGE